MFAKVYQSLRYKYVNRYRALSTLDFGDEPHQFFLVSYPRSGNTWVRFLLANLLKENDDELFLQNLRFFIPDTHDKNQRKYISNEGSAFKQLKFQFLKTHDPFFLYYRNKKVIYIVRDGRDVINSFYHYQNSRTNKTISIIDLVKWNKDIPMGIWSDHVTNWTCAECKNKLIIKYEDLIADPYGETMRLLSWLGWRLDQSSVHDAIKNSSIGNLQRLEEKHGVFYKDKIGAGNQTLFFRKGEVGDWKHTFSSADLQAFWKIHGKGMRHFGYS